MPFIVLVHKTLKMLKKRNITTLKSLSNSESCWERVFDTNKRSLLLLYKKTLLMLGEYRARYTTIYNQSVATLDELQRQNTISEQKYK